MGARDDPGAVRVVAACDVHAVAAELDQHLAEVASRALLSSRVEKDIREVLAAYAKDIDIG